MTCVRIACMNVHLACPFSTYTRLIQACSIFSTNIVHSTGSSKSLGNMATSLCREPGINFVANSGCSARAVPVLSHAGGLRAGVARVAITTNKLEQYFSNSITSRIAKGKLRYCSEFQGMAQNLAITFQVKNKVLFDFCMSSCNISAISIIIL